MMAANPIMRALEKLVSANGGDRWILDRLANGERVGDIARDCIIEGYGPISRPFLYRWRDKSEDRREGWKLAMQDAAHAHAEQAGDVLDKLADADTLLLSSAQVSLAKSRSEYKRWLASKLNEEYRDGPQVQVGILAAGDLHLDALRQLGSMDRYRVERAAEVVLIPAETGDDDE